MHACENDHSPNGYEKSRGSHSHGTTRCPICLEIITHAYHQKENKGGL